MRSVRRTCTACLVALLAAIALSASGCSRQSAAATSDKCSRAATPATSNTATATFGDVRIKVPKSWFATPACFITSGTSVPLGYLTTQHPIAQCREGRPGSQGHESCGDPVDQLGEQDVLVRVMQEASPTRAIPIGKIAGTRLQSRDDSSGDGERCVITEQLRTRHEFITIVALFGSQERGTVLRILRTVKNAP